MSLAGDEEPPPLASALPSHVAEKRDALGSFCFYLHFAVMIYIVLGWLIPLHAVLWFYVAFIPLVAVQWQFNKNSCVLNNLESLIRYGRWRDPNNKEEGAWLLTLAVGLFGYPFKAWHIEVFTYAVILLLWLLGLSHLLWW
ncbi:MAG: hypothetical protein JSR60_15150 [Proteobacteria bacterium]|nr:hypothetical protein [Pseudomonadota bacterium]